MAGWGNSTTPRGTDDQRTQQKGHRVLFDKTTQTEAWACARVLKRLTPWEQRAVRLLAEAFLAEHVATEIEKGRA